MSFALPEGVAVEEEKDSLGGGVVVNAEVYKGTLENVYQDKSDGGAISINIHFKMEDGKVLKQVVYISNRAGGFTYNDKNGKAQPLPGYSQMNSFFKAATGKGIAENQATEEKMVKIYKDNKETPLPRDCFVDAIGTEIAIGILKISEEKTTKSGGKDEKGKDIYVGTGEFREINEFDKFFDAASGLTVVEKLAGAETPEFLAAWKEKNAGKVKVKKAKISGTASGATAGAPAASAAPAKKLFS